MNKKVVIAVVLVIGAAGSAFYSFSALSGKSEESPPLPLEGAEPDLEAGAGAAAPLIPGLRPVSSPERDGEGAAAGEAAEKPPEGTSTPKETPEKNPGTAKTAPPSPNRIEEILNSLIERRKRITLSQEREKAAREKASARAASSEGGLNQETKRPSRNVLENLECRGILYGSGRSCALIGGYILKEGDALPNGCQVAKINPKSVVLREKTGGREFVVFLEPLSGSPPTDDETTPGTEKNGANGAPAAPPPAEEEGK